MYQQNYLKSFQISFTNVYPLCLFLILGLSFKMSAQPYACTELSIARDYKGNLRRKSYVVSGLYLIFSPDSIQVFGNYNGRYISNVFKITKTIKDTMYADGGFIKKGAEVKMVFRNNTLSSDYNIVDDDGESKVSLILSLKPAQNHFSEKQHKRKEIQQTRSIHRDLLGREKK